MKISKDKKIDWNSLKDPVSLLEIHKSRRLYWIDSLPTLRRWVVLDSKKNNYLKAEKVGEGLKTRYYFQKANVDEFVRAYEKMEL